MSGILDEGVDWWSALDIGWFLSDLVRARRTHWRWVEHAIDWGDVNPFGQYGVSREGEAVVCEGDIRGELGIGLCVENVVGHVDQVGPRRVDLGDGFEGLVDGEMGGVRAVAQGIEDKGFGACEGVEGLAGDIGDIGAVGQGEEGGCGVGHVESEPEDGELAVVEGDGGDGEPEECEGGEGFDDVGDKLGDE